MKIEGTPKEIADFVVEIQNRLLDITEVKRLQIQELRKIADYYGFDDDKDLKDKLERKEKELGIRHDRPSHAEWHGRVYNVHPPKLYVAKDNDEYFTLDKDKAKVDSCGNRFIAHL